MRRATLALIGEDARVGLLLTDEDFPAFAGISATFQSVGSAGKLEDVARQLFATLRALDQAGVSVILVRDFGTAGLGLAIRDRLVRAADGSVIEVCDT
jgi:L-threonylcarbamoyladenylate synthase